MKLLLIKILLKLLGIPHHKIDEKRIRMWFWTAYPQQGFNDYITKRDIAILQEMGSAVDRETYLMLLGQRTEIGMMLTQAKRAFARVEADRKEKVQAIKKNENNRNKEN